MYEVLCHSGSNFSIYIHFSDLCPYTEKKYGGQDHMFAKVFICDICSTFDGVYAKKNSGHLDPQKMVKIFTSGLSSIQDGRQTIQPIKNLKMVCDSLYCRLTAHKVSKF